MKPQYKIENGIKVWKRICWGCNCTINHINRHSWWTSRNKNRLCYSCNNKGENNPFYGKEHSDEWRLMTATRFSNYRIKISKPELKLAAILVSMNVIFIQQYEIGNRFFDFMLPDFNLLIEVDGKYWHGRGLRNDELSNSQRHTIKNDNFKTELAAQFGYTLLRVWEDELEDVSKYLYNKQNRI